MSANEPKVPSGWIDSAWDGSASQWPDAGAYCGACLIDLNPDGAEKVKDLCMLPYKEPGGKTNVQGVLACAGGRGISRVKRPGGISQSAWDTAKRAAANKLLGLYEQMNRTAPNVVYALAGKTPPGQ